MGIVVPVGPRAADAAATGWLLGAAASLLVLLPGFPGTALAPTPLARGEAPAPETPKSVPKATEPAALPASAAAQPIFVRAVRRADGGVGVIRSYGLSPRAADVAPDRPLEPFTQLTSRPDGGVSRISFYGYSTGDRKTPGYIVASSRLAEFVEPR